jgi:hypothetical protein
VRVCVLVCASVYACVFVTKREREREIDRERESNCMLGREMCSLLTKAYTIRPET